MNDYMNKFIRIVKSLIDTKKIPKIEYTDFDIYDLQNLMLDFTIMLSYDTNSVLKDNNIMKDAFCEDLFYNKSYFPGTQDYHTILSQHRPLKNMQNNQFYNTSSGLDSHASLSTTYQQFIKKNDVISSYIGIDPIYDMRAEKISAEMFAKVPEIEGIEEENGVYYYTDPNASGDKTASIYCDGKNYWLVPYDMRRNPFSKRHFRLFDKNGEIDNLENLNYVDIIRQIRNAEAHHSVQNYLNGYGYGGKLVKLKKGQVALFSNKWHERMLNMAYSTYRGYGDQQTFLHTPIQKQISNAQQCEELINNIRVIDIKFGKTVNNEHAEVVINGILDNYERLENPTMSIKEYLNTHVPKVFPEAKIEIKPIEQKQILLARLQDEGFYKIAPTAKDNIINQRYTIKRMVLEKYGKELISNKGVKPNGRFNPVKINLFRMSGVIQSDMAVVQYLGGYFKKVVPWSQYDQEKLIGLTALCIFRNLIRNNFVDNIVEMHYDIPKGYVMQYKNEDIVNSVKTLDMSLFEFYNPKKAEGYSAETVKQKYTILKTLRNAVSHDGMYIKYNRNCDFNESQFVFYPSQETDIQIRVNCQDLLEFVQNPLFANYVGMGGGSLADQTVKELKQTIKKMCGEPERQGSENANS